jgi:glycosyltransferase involved in cell wall biosynthesis
MVRYASVKNNRICIISEQPIVNQELESIELPDELNDLLSIDLMGCRVKNGQVKHRLIKKPISQIKLALVSNFREMCGISTYFEHLAPELVKNVGDFKLFIEKNGPPTGDLGMLGDQILLDDQLSICWKRGEPLTALLEEIKDYDPDVILINHEFGLWPNARYWLSFLTQLSDYRVIVVMHSVFPNHQDKMLYEASMTEIVVHLESAKRNLEQEKKVNTKVYVIPHGCYPVVEDQSRLWNNYKSEHTFIQQGFAHSYKAFDRSIRAVAILKNKYPDVFFTAILAESSHNKSAHQNYYNFLFDLIEELGVQQNVGLIRGFQPDNIINSYLRSNRVALFPYSLIPGHECMGSSGSARVAMAAGLPVISSSIYHFSDLPTIKAETPEQIAIELDKLFNSIELRKEQVAKQNQFIEEHSWEKVAEKFLEVLGGLHE